MPKSPTLRRRIVAPGPWLEALVAPRQAIVVNTLYSGYHGHAGPWNSGRRTLSDHLIYLTTGGSGEATVDGQTFRLEPGMLMWIPAGVPHEIQYTHIDHYVLRFQLTAGATLIVPNQRLLLQTNALELCPILDQIRNEILAPPSWSEHRLRALFVLFFTALFHLRANREAGVRTLTPFQRNQLIGYVHAHIDIRIEPAALARCVGLSHDYFSRLFRQAFGLPPRAWLMRERIRLASMKMLVSQSSVKQIANEFGYHDVALFSRQFKQVLGRNPRAFRKGRLLPDAARR